MWSKRFRSNEHCELFIEVMDKVCPTFGHFSVHEQKLMKLSWYLTVSSSQLNNIFLKSFWLLQNLMRNCKILEKWMRFHEIIDISWDFSGIILCLCSDAMYFVDFQICFWYFCRWLQIFGFVQTDLKFWSLKLGDGKSYKSQYRS